MSSAEALRDVLRFLNQQEFDGCLDDEPLSIVGDAIVAAYASLHLGSRFQPIIALDDSLLGYQALSTVTSATMRDSRLLDVSKLTLTANDRHEVVYLDRLTRTLHALNYLASGLCRDLHLIVNPQHLQAVHANHGQVFAQILAQCGLEPGCIVLEIAESGVVDKKHLRAAVSGWQQRNYRIAINFDGEYDQLKRVINLKPEFIKIDGKVMKRLADNLTSNRLLESMLGEVRSYGIHIIATGIDDAARYDLASSHEIMAWQGQYSAVNSLADSAEKVA